MPKNLVRFAQARFRSGSVDRPQIDRPVRSKPERTLLEGVARPPLAMLD